MESDRSPIHIVRVFDAPRALVYRAFTDPDQLAAWWGPVGNSVHRDSMEFNVRTGGFQKWVERVESDPDARIHVHIDLTEVRDDELLEGVMHVSGPRNDGYEPFETTFRFSFSDEPDARTRLEIRQWLPPHLARPSGQGWSEAFAKLDAALKQAPTGSAG